MKIKDLWITMGWKTLAQVIGLGMNIIGQILLLLEEPEINMVNIKTGKSDKNIPAIKQMRKQGIQLNWIIYNFINHIRSNK